MENLDVQLTSGQTAPVRVGPFTQRGVGRIDFAAEGVTVTLSAILVTERWGRDWPAYWDFGEVEQGELAVTGAVVTGVAGKPGYLDIALSDDLEPGDYVYQLTVTDGDGLVRYLPERFGQYRLEVHPRLG